jgi:hypothetical protein
LSIRLILLVVLVVLFPLARLTNDFEKGSTAANCPAKLSLMEVV